MYHRLRWANRSLARGRKSHGSASSRRTTVVPHACRSHISKWPRRRRSGVSHRVMTCKAEPNRSPTAELELLGSKYQPIDNLKQ